MSAAKKVTGKRYSDAERAEIIEFVRKHDAENRRGGKTAAVKKFGVTALTLAAWIAKAGGKSAGKKAAKKGSVKAASASRTKIVGNGRSSSFEAKVKQLLALSKEIETAEANLAKLKQRFASMKTGL